MPIGVAFLAGALASLVYAQESRTLTGAPVVGTGFQPSATLTAAPIPPPSTVSLTNTGTQIETLPPPPEAVVAVGGDAAVSVSWLLAPAPDILGYNIYRSSKQGSYGTVPINRSLVKGTEFIDSDANSTIPPANGTIYFYTVKSVDLQGRLSLQSEEARARPEGAQVISEVPRVAWEGMGDSQLSVSGRKVVSLGYTIREPKYSPGSSQLSGPLTQRPDIQQQLQVRLSGTVGKKIAVEVDYDDTAPEQTRQRISVVYTGEPQETIERAEFGDIRLELSDTEFTGYDKQLFGVRIQAQPIERLRVTGIATQTQGINASEQFVGSSARQEVDVADTSYVTFKYFHITRPDLVTANLGVRPGTEQIWLDDGLSSNNTVNTRVVAGYSFDLMYQGVDYSIDYATGVISFNRNIPANASIAVAFEFNNGNKVGFTGGDIGTELAANLRSNYDITCTCWAETTPEYHLIYEGSKTGQGDAHMITNWYQLGFRNIVPKDFDSEFAVRVTDSSGNEQTGIVVPVLDADFYDFGLVKLEGGPGRGQPLPNPPVDEQPFAYKPDNGFYGAGNNAYRYGTDTRTASRYSVRIRFLTRVLSYRLRNINIVRGSERITMDGRVLRRDVDYFIDYDFGQVTFLRPDQIRYDSNIQIDYEYLPFGGQFQSFLWGARGQYSLSEKASVGGTFLSNNSQNPPEVPSPTAAPKSTTIAGLDGRVFLSRRDLSSLTSVAPGFEKTVLPFEMEVRGEVARSDINPNTYKQAGVDEDGVGMIDSFEGVDDVVEASVDDSSWFPASAPSGAGWTNAQRAVVTAGNPGVLAWDTLDGGHASDLERTLDIEYKDLGSANWDGLRYVLSPIGLDLTNFQYLGMWVWGDGNGVTMGVDLGVVSEDVRDPAWGLSTEPLALTEDKNGDFLLNAGEDIGIAPGGANPAYWGGKGTFWNGWIGPGSDVVDTEDTNSNNLVDRTENYYEYKFRVDWSGWNYVKIPLSFASTTGKSIPIDTTKGRKWVSFSKVNLADKSVVHHMRIWLTDGGNLPAAHKIRLENIAVSGNRWLLRTAPGATIPVDSSRFNVSAISEEISSAYTPLLKFYTVDEEDSDIREQSLQLDYSLWDNLGGNYFAARTFASAMNMFDYEELRFELNKYRVINGGEVLFLRLGADELNYYQYNIPLDSIGPGWQTVKLDFNDERNRTRVGNPALSSVKQFAFGVIRYDPQSAGVVPETLWINNLRLTGSRHKTGIARKINIRIATPMGATYLADPSQEILPSNVGIAVDTTFRELDNDFRMIDQPMYLFDDQHKRNVVSQAQIRQIPKLPIQVLYQKDETWVEKRHREDPAYFTRPQQTKESVNTTVASEHLSPVSVDVSTSHERTETRYLTQLAGTPDLNKVKWSVAPRIRVPLDGWWLIVPVGSNGELSGVASYTKETYDYISPHVLAVKDYRTETLDEQYNARTNYQPFAGYKRWLPVLPGFSTAPRGGYKLRRSRGTVGSAASSNIANAVTFVSEDRFQPVTQEVTAGLDNTLGGIRGITPSSNYSGQVSRDFTVMSMNSVTSLNNTLEIRPGEWWKNLVDQSFNLGYNIETNGQYYDITRVDASGRRYVTGAVTEHVPSRDLWWISRKNDDLTTSNAYAETYTAAGSLRFFRTWQMTPNWSFREDTRLAQKLRTRTTAITAGSGLALLRGELVAAMFEPTPLFWMHFSGFDAGYTYRKTTTFDFRDLPTRIDESHSTTATLPFSPVRNMTGNLSFTSDITTSRIPPFIKTFQRNYRPSLGLAYSHNAGLNIPLLWWKIKLSNLITVRHNLQLNYIDNEAVGQNYGNRRAREISDSTEFEYEMLRGVSFRMTEKYDKVTDYTSPINNFWAFSLYATFLFNF